MSKEIIQKAEKIISKAIHTEWNNAETRRCLYEEMNMSDNPHSIVEELNTIIPWFQDPPKFKYRVDGRKIVLEENP